MDEHFILIDADYNKDFFETIYENSSLDVSSSPIFKSVNDDANITMYPEIEELFEKFCIEVNPKNCSLTQICKSVPPHTNPGNNGLIIFPIRGNLEISFYSYAPPVINGMTSLSPYPKDRVKLNPNELSSLLNSKFKSIVVNQPIAVNGRQIYSYRPIGNELPLVFLLKIPFNIDWNTIKIIIENSYA